MPVTICEPPSKRASGRQPRLSIEDVKDFAEGIQEGLKAAKAGKKPNWLTDSEPVKTRSAAYQRAQSARDLVIEFLGETYQVDSIKTGVQSVPTSDLTKIQIDILSKAEKLTAEQVKGLSEVYIWKIGPRPEGEQPRRSRGTNQ